MSTVLQSIFQDIANSIRSKTGTNDRISPINMANAINDIEAGNNNDSYYTLFQGYIPYSEEDTIDLNKADIVLGSIEQKEITITQNFSKVIALNDSQINIGNLDVSKTTIAGIKNGVTNIAYIFNNATEFNQPINIPDSVVNMSHAFNGCSKFDQNIIIPNNVVNMSHAFSNCDSLKTCLNIPDTVEDISFIFSNSLNINTSDFKIPNNVKNICGLYYNSPYNSPRTIPETATDIGWLFYNTVLPNNFTIPDRITGISGLYYNTNISDTNIIIPKQIKDISYLFYNSNLNNINIIFENEYNIINASHIYDNTICDNIMPIPNGTQNISYAFANTTFDSKNISSIECNALSFTKNYIPLIILSNKITNASGLFYNANLNTSFNYDIFSNNIKDLSYAFYNTSCDISFLYKLDKLENISYIAYNATAINSSFFNLPNSLINMSYAFYNYNGIVPYSIPSNVKDMSYAYAYTNINKYSTITLPLFNNINIEGLFLGTNIADRKILADAKLVNNVYKYSNSITHLEFGSNVQYIDNIFVDPCNGYDYFIKLSNSTSPNLTSIKNVFVSTNNKNTFNLSVFLYNLSNINIDKLFYNGYTGKKEVYLYNCDNINGYLFDNSSGSVYISNSSNLNLYLFNNSNGLSFIYTKNINSISNIISNSSGVFYLCDDSGQINSISNIGINSSNSLLRITKFSSNIKEFHNFGVVIDIAGSIMNNSNFMNSIIDMSNAFKDSLLMSGSTVYAGLFFPKNIENMAYAYKNAKNIIFLNHSGLVINSSNKNNIYMPGTLKNLYHMFDGATFYKYSTTSTANYTMYGYTGNMNYTYHTYKHLIFNNTKNLTDVRGMFSNINVGFNSAFSIINIDIRNINDVSYMFYNSRLVDYVYLTNTSNVINAQYMFANYIGQVSSSYISYFTNLTNASHMFENCLHNYYFGSTIYINSKLKDISYMCNNVHSSNNNIFASIYIYTRANGDNSVLENMDYAFYNMYQSSPYDPYNNHSKIYFDSESNISINGINYNNCFILPKTLKSAKNAFYNAYLGFYNGYYNRYNIILEDGITNGDYMFAGSIFGNATFNIYIPDTLVNAQYMFSDLNKSSGNINIFISNNSNIINAEYMFLNSNMSNINMINFSDKMKNIKGIFFNSNVSLSNYGNVYIFNIPSSIEDMSYAFWFKDIDLGQYNYYKNYAICINDQCSNLNIQYAFENVFKNKYNDGYNLSYINMNIYSLNIQNTENLYAGLPNTIFNFDTNLLIRDGFTNISNIFANSNFNQPITIPDGIVNMSYAFANSNFNQPITIPDSIVNMSYAFANSNFGQPITIPTNNIINMNHIFANAKQNIRLHINIPNTVQDINYMFERCRILDTSYINFEEGIEDMSNVFRGSIVGAGLYIKIPDSVKNISNTFRQMSSGGTNPTIILSNNIKNMAYAFAESGFRGTSIYNMPNNVINMAYAFAGSYIPIINNFNKIPDSVEDIRYLYYKANTSGGTLLYNIGNNVKNMAFAYSGVSNYCPSNISINIPDNVEDMSFAFYAANYVNINKEIKIGNNVKNMAYAFAGIQNYNIRSIVFSNSVKNLSHCFSGISIDSNNKYMSFPSVPNNAEDISYMYDFYYYNTYWGVSGSINSSTIKNMAYAFGSGRINKVTCSILQLSNVIDMSYAYYNTNFNCNYNSINIGNTIRYMIGTFQNCIYLNQPYINIPDGAIDITRTYSNCNILCPQQITIPDSVIYMDYTFCNTVLNGTNVIIGNGDKYANNTFALYNNGRTSSYTYYNLGNVYINDIYNLHPINIFGHIQSMNIYCSDADYMVSILPKCFISYSSLSSIPTANLNYCDNGAIICNYSGKYITIYGNYGV